MKKAIKIIRKITKWYLILDAIVCAYIGVCRIIHFVMKYPQKSILEIDEMVLDEANAEFKKNIVTNMLNKRATALLFFIRKEMIY